MATLPQWQPEFYYWLLLTFVVVLERFLPLPRSAHPFFLLHQLAAGMARKVHRPGNSRSQQRISGLMATLSLTLPWLAIAAVVYWIAELDWLFEALVLLLCLHSGRAFSDYRQVQQALAKGQKQLARERLAHYLARDLTPLSELGLRKAAMEYLSRQLMLGWLATLCWFIIGGPLAALAYRMLFELSQAWPVMQKRWRDFGFAVNWLMRGFAWPASVLLWLLLAVRSLLGGNILPWRFAPQSHMHKQDGRLWRALAVRLQCTMGGAIKLDDLRQHRPRFTPGPEPEPHHSKRLPGILTRCQWMVWMLLSPLFLIGLLATWSN